MREAFNLLKQSIIHVEKDDIGFEEEEEAENAANSTDAPMDVDAAEALKTDTAGSSSAAHQPQPAQNKKPQIRITYEKYMGIMTLVLGKLQTVERETGNGIKKSELVQWYLEEMEPDLNSVEELETEKALIGKVLIRLVKVSSSLQKKKITLRVQRIAPHWFAHNFFFGVSLNDLKEKCIMELRGEGLQQQDSEGGESSGNARDPILLVHPECNIGDS